MSSEKPKINNLKKFANPLLRISLSIVFLYFGFQQISNPDAWVSFIPNFITNTIITANNLIILNGIMELTLGTFLLIGIYTRFSALILSIHLFFIALSIGISPLGIRDFGLAIATFVIFLNGPDKFCIDKK